MFNSGDMIDVNNMDSNVDPIDNKYQNNKKTDKKQIIKKSNK